MKDNYSVFIGDVAIDEYYRCQRWPSIADKANCEYLESRMGGTIANAACVYAGYQARTLFSGYLNPDDAYLCNNLQSCSIDTSLTVFDETLGPSKCLIFLSGSEHTVMILNTKITTIPVSKQMQDLYCRADCIYSNLLSLERLRYNEKKPEEILAEWSENNVKVFVDCDVDPVSPAQSALLPYIHTVIFNEVGFNAQKRGRIAKETAEELFSKGVSVVIETLAEDGCMVYTEKAFQHIPGVKTDVVDVTGAGDTFGASFMYFYNLSSDPFLSARFASYAASRSVTVMGARGGVCSAEEVLNYVSAKNGNTEEFLHVLLPQSSDK